MKEPIAVVGIACRFPGSANSPSKLWQLLREPKDVVRDIPKDRLNFANFPNETSTHFHQRAYLLDEDVRHFDAAFFRMNPKEVAGMDPQQRILLETVYESFEAAGWPLHAVEGSQTSVYVGAMTDDYYTIQSGDPDTMDSHASTGLSRGFLANRISYAFNLKGPSMSLDTACSSSLVALHLAVQGLQNGEATQAVVAGVNLLLDPHWFITQSSLHMLSPDCRSRMWDKDANGYARGEGCAAIVLKPLGKAIEDGDPIECVIRGTGVNSDGHTTGITMPSPEAQTSLIRKTYQGAGLDPLRDRCQYFECHGTGTQTGDPIEAQAINDALFTENVVENGPPLYCGSIKTVIGHLEGCAGLAGLIKASLAIQHKFIPPNLHFNVLNPTIQPFYTNLEVPISPIPWPETRDQPRRASVNSFGFGGTNAHAIIESYDPLEEDLSNDPMRQATSDGDNKWPGFIGPFVFSARTKCSLSSMLQHMLEYVRQNPSVDMDTLSHTLQSRRSIFSYRVAIPTVRDREQLISALEELIEADQNSQPAIITNALHNSPSGNESRLLGIFTGQGAQAAQMGKELIEHCKLFRDSIQRCEEALSTLPDPPPWSLQHELMADEVSSRLSEAEISQPLCTAIQIAQVDLLSAIGVKFSAVLGHSSGEIAAAYAAGLLGLRDAMGIAYYRGYVAKLATGPEGEDGAMLATSMTYSDAIKLCDEAWYDGRVSVAASNAPCSVTYSGNLDAIEEIEEYLDESQIQFKRLRVDTAYHSQHMIPCAEPYLSHLKKLNIKIRTGEAQGSCRWISSVRPESDILSENAHEHELDGQYWVSNMVQTVLFSRAVEIALQCDPGHFTMAIEVGPHPALKGPVSQTLKPILSTALPYASCLRRNQSDIETLSEALGMLWMRSNTIEVDFASWREAFGLQACPGVVKGLPSYSWDHDQVHWRESRVSRDYRLGHVGQEWHSLLGHLRDNFPSEKRWRKILCLDEMPWLKHHTFQGQVLFPAAAYVTAAIEATKLFVGDRHVRMVEVQNMNILKPLVVDEYDGAELLFTIRSKVSPTTAPNNSAIKAQVICHGSSDNRVLETTCEADLLIHMGERDAAVLQPNFMSKSELTPLSEDRFYHAVAGLGIVYEGSFKKLTSIRRSWGLARATASWEVEDLQDGYMLHPAILDTGFQAGLATFISTAEKSMGTTHLPVCIRRVVVDLSLSTQNTPTLISVDIEATMGNHDRSFVETDITIASESATSSINIEGLVLKSVGEPEPSDDRNLFAKTIWGIGNPYGLTMSKAVPSSLEETVKMNDVYERVTLFYMRELARHIDREPPTQMKWHHQELLRYINTTLANACDDLYPFDQTEWFLDNQESIDRLCNGHTDDVAVAMLTTVGQNLPSVVRGESEMMEHMLEDNLLGRLYREDHRFATCNAYVADIMRQVSHKFPRAHILEIGAGTGATTVGVFNAIGDAYSSYTCTDISASFFSTLEQNIPDGRSGKVSFKVFNVEKSPGVQGFEEGGYDVVIAANVLHATRKLSETIRNTRALLRPGGYLIAIEVTGNMLRETGLMGALEGWWLGVDEGRTTGPGISPKRWDDILRLHGFSGVDCISYDHSDLSRHSCSVFMSQATDKRVDILRDPVSSMEDIPTCPLFIIGGVSLAVSRFIIQIKKLLARWSTEIKVYDTIEQFDSANIPPGAFVLCLADLDKPFFAHKMTDSRLSKLQDLLALSKNVLWVTAGRMSESPYANMVIGVGRALAVELPHVNINYLDFNSATLWDADFIVRHVLEISFSSSSGKTVENMLWTSEPEVLLKDGQVLVPRVVPDPIANELYNAKRRTIKKLLSSDDRVEIVHDVAFSRARLVKGDALYVPAGHAVVNVDMSLAIHVSEESPCFLCFGKFQRSGEAVFALVETASSAVVVPKESVFKIPGIQMPDIQTLAAMASALIISTILSTVSTRGTILLYGAPTNVQGMISTLATNMGQRLLCLNVATGGSRDEIQGCIVIHPCVPTRHIRSQIPHDSAVLYSLSNDGIETVLPLVPKDGVVQPFDPGFTIRQPANIVSQSLENAYRAYQTLSPKTLQSVSLEVVNLRDVPDQLHTHRERFSAAVVYDRDLPVHAVLQPLDPRNMLSSKKTYFFVGMTGELGQSLCRYIVQAGARHIVLASRNPTENTEWVSEMRSIGVDLRIARMDVTLQSQVRETVAMMRRAMPPIGGVANAALVLESGIFVNASAESAERQLKPKVAGLSYLDQEFSNDSLDFFLAFGSLGTVCGTAGQAVYHAGNMFMSSMIEKRRRRGQAASILQLGLLVDVGYVSRTDREQSTDLEGTLRAFSLTPLSESEFHYAVLQAIMSGKPDSASGEVIVGIEPYVDHGGKTNRSSWVDKARFSAMVKSPVSAATSNPPNVLPQSTLVARDDLNKARNVDEAVSAVQKMVCRKISTMVRIPESSIDRNSPLTDVGLDSLHAIEIRNWLSKEINIRLPLLRILGREPLSSLCMSVAKEFVDNKPMRDDIPDGTGVTPALPIQVNDLEDNMSQCVHVVTKEIVSEVTNGFPPSQDEDNRSQTPSTPVDTATPTSDSVASGQVPWGRRPVDTNGDVPCSLLNMDGLGRQAELEAKIIMRKPSTTESASDYHRAERLSFAQAGIHFLHTLSERPTSLNVTVQYTVKGSLNTDRLSRAIETVLSHYQAHQTCYFADSGSAETRQCLAKEAKQSRLTTLEGTEEDAQFAFDTISNQEYSLSTGETFRAVLVTHEPERHSLIFGFHLIASDAYSFSIFLKELNRAYQMLPLSPNPGLFLDFASQQHQDLEYGKFSESITYWKSQLLPLAASMPLLPISKAKSRQARQFYGNNKASRQLNSSVVGNISKVSQLHGATCMQFYLAVLQVLLMRFAEIGDMSIGVTDSGRDPTGDFVNSIGHFANMLPMRFKTDLGQSFESLLKATSQIVLRSFEHSQIPFDALLEKFGIERSPLSTPVFQVAFNYRLGDIMQQPLGDCMMTMEKNDDVKTAYDLTMNVTKTAKQGHLLDCITADNLYSPTATEFILDTFISLFEVFLQDQSVRIQECPLFSDEQIQHGTSLGRGPSRTFSWERTLSERFMQVASDFPHSVATKDQDNSLTYGQLSDKVAECAVRVLDANVEFGSRIIVLCEPSVDLYTTMLAILHIGAVYVPLDATLPHTCQIAIVEACCPDLLIYHEATSKSAIALKDTPGLKSISLSDLHACPIEHQQLSSCATLTGEEDAFILFTSGTTSTPKGIRLSQSGIMNYAASKSGLLGLDQVMVLQQTSISFDMAIAQAFNAFANGGTLVIAPSNVRGDPIELAKLMLAENIQFTLCTPSEYLMLTAFASETLKKCSSWRYACSGGEVVTKGLLNAMQNLELPSLTFTDCYGPTELSCATTFRQVELIPPVVNTVSDAPIAPDEVGRSVGMPIPNTHIYILSESDSSPLPQGMPGEICVAGSGVAKGYLLEELNQQKFVSNPFATLHDKAQGWHVMYRTGDRGFLQPDGSLTFLGRTDGGSAVIKLRGMRIDLGEVANAVIKAASHNGAVDAVVVARGEPQYLICYAVLATGVFMKQQQLQSVLRDVELPRYMIPSAIFTLERFPITSNGKIDRAALEALPVPDEAHRSDESVSTLTVPEIELQNIWRDVLGEAARTAEIGPDTDFFTVGGSSLLLVHLQSALTDRIGVTLSLQQLYQATSLRPMSVLMHADRIQLTEDKIDWDEETCIPANFQDTVPSSLIVALRKHKRHVLLTGSTSFLGQEILRQLIANNDVEKIHCIAVPDAERHNVPMQEHSKVVIYSGSLQSLTLGLSSKQIEFLQSNVDQIIHAAVQGHCMNNYKSVRQALYLSTQSLFRLVALPRRVPFHFVSAPRVVLLSGKVEGLPVSMSLYYPPTDGSQGVTAANWASERFLENASRGFGLPVVINRHCALVGERAPADDVMNSVIRFSLLTGRVPHIPAATGFLDFEDVSVIAAELANQPLASPGQVFFRHQSSNVRVPFSKLAWRLQQIHDREFEVVDASEWLDCAVTAGMEHLLFIHLKATMATGSPITFPYLGE